MNKSLFEEKWKLIRGEINTRWSLMVEYDLVKVDKADVKFDKFVTMLQVKYGYTRQQAKKNKRPSKGMRKHNRKVKQEARRVSVPGTEVKKNKRPA